MTAVSTFHSTSANQSLISFVLQTRTNVACACGVALVPSCGKRTQMTKTAKTARAIVLAVGIVGIGWLTVQAAPASADPPAHAPAYGYRNKQDKNKHDKRESNGTWRKERDKRETERAGKRRDRDERENRYGRVSRNEARHPRTPSARYPRLARDRDNDRDNDGIRDARDRDRDGDGILNTRDHYPSDPRRH